MWSNNDGMDPNWRPTPPSIDELQEKCRKYKEMLFEANDVLRSAHSVASRDGLQTNWQAFRELLDKTLKDQHAVLWPSSDQDPLARDGK